MISLIVAKAQNDVIGDSNKLPWYLPADLKRFKELTTGRKVVMGRKTFDSIIRTLGRPLPNRTNIVITRNLNFVAIPGVIVAHSLEEALNKTNNLKEVFVIGGAQIYQQALPLADRIYLTEVKANITGDTYFPATNYDSWTEVSRENHLKDDKNEYDYDFVVLDRKR